MMQNPLVTPGAGAVDMYLSEALRCHVRENAESWNRDVVSRECVFWESKVCVRVCVCVRLLHPNFVI